jgi:hypothetical protein
MTESWFDPKHAVRFDLPRGTVRARGDEGRVVLVPTSALDDLVRSLPPEATEALARSLGAAIGRRAAARMGDPQGTSVEEFVAQLAGEAAVAGVGALSVERWGRALVVVVEESALAVSLLAPLISSALEVASGRRAWCALLSADDRVVRLVVGSEPSMRRVRDWLASGVRWGDALVRLHGDGGSS